MTKHEASVYESRENREQLELVCTCGLKVTKNYAGQPFTKADYAKVQGYADFHNRTGSTRF